LIKWTAEPALLPRITFGKYRGTKWADVDEGFLRWVADRDFDEDTLFTARSELERRRRSP
jgi:exodeoxyribonuclease X